MTFKQDHFPHLRILTQLDIDVIFLFYTLDMLIEGKETDPYKMDLPVHKINENENENHQIHVNLCD